MLCLDLMEPYSSSTDVTHGIKQYRLFTSLSFKNVFFHLTSQTPEYVFFILSSYLWPLTSFETGEEVSVPPQTALELVVCQLKTFLFVRKQCNLLRGGLWPSSPVKLKNSLLWLC